MYDSSIFDFDPVIMVFSLSFQYAGANIQLLDLPGIIEGAAQGNFMILLY